MPDVFLTRRQILLAKIETSYGTDAVPQASNSYEAIRLIDPFVLDLGQDMVEVSGGNLSRGRSRPIATVRPTGITFRSYVHGITSPASGYIYTAAAKPALGDLFRACAMFETLETVGYAGGRYRYAPSADVGSDSSVTIVAHQDGFEHRILGCRGNVNFIYQGSAPVIAEFNLRGMLSTEASTTRSAPTGLPTIVPPRWVGSGSIFVESLSGVVENLNLNTNNTVLEDRASNASSGSGITAIILTDRAPGGSFDPEATDPGTLNFFAQWRASSGAVLSVQTNVTTGNRFTLTASQVVFKKVSWGDKSGLSVFASDFEAYERSGQDEWNLVFD